MRKANYDKFPSTKISGTIVQGWNEKRTSYYVKGKKHFSQLK